MGVALFPSFFCELICNFISPNAGVCWYPLKNYIGSLSEGVDVLCELLFVVSGSPDMRACRADNESVRKTAFLGFSSHEMMVSVAGRK